MNPVDPWLDADEVRRMALRLIKPAREAAANIADAGFDEAFVGFTDASAASPAPLVTREESITPPPATPVVAPVTKPAKTSTATARGPFLDRIRRFRDWLKNEFAASGVFILDREGAVIFDESELGRLHFLARSLALASRRPGTSAANVHVKIGASTTLEVIPVETAYGCLVLGAVVPEALPPPSVSAVMEALAQVAAPQG